MKKKLPEQAAAKAGLSVLELVLMAFYGAVLFAIYYMTDDYIWLGGIQLRVRFLLSVGLTLAAFVHFLLFTNLKRGAAVVSHTFILILPSLVLLFSSVPVWVAETADVSVMRRGLIDQFYDIAMITAMGGLVYVFGQRAFQLNMLAVLAAYLMKLLAVITANGLVPFMNEFVTLVVTFADNTGPIMEAAELHEPTFCLGFLLLGIGLTGKRSDKLLMLEFVIGMFCFLTGFKRIAVAAAAVAVVSKIALMLATKRGKKNLWIVTMCSWICIGVCFAYLAATKLGLFEFLEEEFGINTMGRAWLSYMVDKLYTITPDFMGHGTGFISRFMSEGSSTIKALHNGPLQIYIDNGFWGFWIWGMTFLPMRVTHFAKTRGGQAGIVAFCCTLTLIITSLTDNTIFYADVAGALAMVMLNYRMEVDTL